ncbi:MAG: ABC transporter permease [Burkholderiaceae bacterium]|jgi:putative ABC transport system permease protein|nr:ABC transporter permease [Burkholderiaceae bacterium]
MATIHAAPPPVARSGLRGWAWLLWQLIGGYARQHPLRSAVQLAAIAIGVALGYAVHLINASALAEFSSAVRQVTGQADAAVVGPREGFADDLFGRVAADARVALASPVLEVEAPIVEPARLRGRTLPVVGVDILRAAVLAPAWVGEPVDTPTRTADTRYALLDDGLYLSAAALQSLGLSPGDTLALQAGDRVERIVIAGRLPRAREGHVVGAMDIGFTQWRLDRLGLITRIDLQLAGGARIEDLARDLQLPAGVALQGADAASTRVSNLSRAYRVNLNVLALVALFTGAFLVYSLQAQSVMARRTQLAFLRVIGLTRREVERLLLAEAALLGVVGALAGVLAGVGIAAVALRVLGGDLGGGYFAGVAPTLVVDPWIAAGFALLGIGAALVGGWLPAREAAAARPALALKSGSGLDQERERQRAWPGLALLGLAALLLSLPPLAGIPVGAYLAIAVLLVAAILLKPLVAPWLFSPLARWLDARAGTAAPWWLAATRLAATPRFAAIGAAGIVASFALMVAMATMVASFRHSVDDWLGKVLPADVYVRAGAAAGGNLGATTASLSARDQATLRGHPQVARVEFSRNVKLLLDPQRASVALIARPVDRSNAAAQLPLTGAGAAWRDGLPPPIWVSEAMVELYGARVGSTLDLPIAGRLQPFFVAGVWRDYARQTGAIFIDFDDYARAAGDATRTEASLWLAPGANASQVMTELAAKLDARAAEFTESGAIRALSLKIFDRSFAVTYVLELVAIVIGLIGIAATFSAQAIARTREFGMLRHLGVTRGQVLALLAIEGLMVTLLAIVLGLAAGLAVAWVLVDIVNPQSFLWTMDFRLPLGLVAGLVAALLLAATVTALAAGRRAVSGEAVLAVREDW